MNEQETYRRAIKQWGELFQCLQAIEEMAELTTAIIHRFRNRCEASQVQEEIADVEIMISQLRLMFGSYEVDQFKTKKLARLRRLVVEGENG